MALMPSERTRRYYKRRRREVLAMPRIPCACGCGTMIPPLTTNLKPAKFAQGHAGKIVGPKALKRWREQHGAWNKGRKMPASYRHPLKGQTLPKAQIAQRTATRRSKFDGAYVSPHARGWKASSDTRRRMSEAKLLNPLSGDRNPAWRGGTSFSPYPPAFNKALKAQVLSEQDYTCADCQHRIGPGGKKQNVHHKDGNKNNCARHNLVALCVSCHMKREWEVNRLTRRREAWKKQPYVVPGVVLASVGVREAVI